MKTMSFTDPFDFAGIRKEQNEWRENARQSLLPGIDPADLQPGMRVTLSPNLRTGDRSGTTELHTVIAFNTGHVQTRTDDGFYKDRPGIWLVSEHHFYAAGGFEASST